MQTTTPPEIEIRKKQRDSNLELLRIVAMIAIIAHHYVVNSTVTQYFVYDGDATPQQYFLEVWGMWGKTGINAFILISGYFMCRMDLTFKRYAKLLIQILFYGISIMLIFALCDYEPLSVKGIFNKLFGLLKHINGGFSASFMAFYAFVPFYNKLITVLTEKQLRMLVIGMLFVMTICATFFFAPTMNEPVWYITLYFVAAYIRLYPNKWTDNGRLSLTILLTSIIIAVGVCLSCVYMANHYGYAILSGYKWHLVSDSNKLLAFVIGLTAFLTAKNFKMGHSKIVNSLAAGCFGVLLIHASSDTMRRWLWQDVCNVPGMLRADMPTLIIQAIAIPIIIFLICSFIDHYYKRFMEPILIGLFFKNNKIAQSKVAGR